MQRPMKRCARSIALSAALLPVLPSIARADGIDAAWFISRIGGWDVNPAWSAAMLIGLMAINYFWNLIVIGVSVARAKNVGVATILPGLASFTLLGQIADRIGAVAGIALAIVPAEAMGFRGENSIAAVFLMGIAFNFVLSGLAIGFLALVFLRRWWWMEKGLSRSLAIRAAVLTNPAWVMGLWFFPGL